MRNWAICRPQGSELYWRRLKMSSVYLVQKAWLQFGHTPMSSPMSCAGYWQSAVNSNSSSNCYNNLRPKKTPPCNPVAAICWIGCAYSFEMGTMWAKTVSLRTEKIQAKPAHQGASLMFIFGRNWNMWVKTVSLRTEHFQRKPVHPSVEDLKFSGKSIVSG